MAKEPWELREERDNASRRGDFEARERLSQQYNEAVRKEEERDRARPSDDDGAWENYN